MFGFGKRDEKKDTEEVVDSSAKSYNFTNSANLPKAKAEPKPAARTQMPPMPQQQPMMAGGIPAHMDDNQKIVIQAQRGGRKRADQDKIDRGEMSMFAEKMASLVGPSYVIAFFGGGIYGATHVPELRQRRTTRLMVNAYLDNVGKTASRFGNNSAAAVFLYILTGKLINHIFLEEFEDFNIGDRYKNTIYGGVAGAIYKSTRGFRPMCLGALLGATMGTGYAYVYRRNFFMG